MESLVSAHPADETLVSYGLGKLDDTLSESVSKHLKGCDPCRRRVAELSSDSFVGRLREAQPQPPPRSQLGDASRRPMTIAEPDPDAVPPITNRGLPPELADHPQYEVI